MTIEIHELVIRAEVRDEPPSQTAMRLSREEREKMITQVIERVLRELDYRQEKRL